jgi:hypothetical protein
VKIRKFSIMLILALCLSLTPLSAFAESTAVSLNAVASIEQGGTVVISGTSTFDEVIIKVLRPGNSSTVFYDIAKVASGQFSVSFTLLSSEAVGTYKVIAGQSNEVATQDLVVTAAEVVEPPAPPIEPVIAVPSVGGGSTPDQTELPVTIGGKSVPSIAAVTTSEQDGKTVLTVMVDAAKLTEQLANAGDKPVVVIPVTSSADKVTAVLTGDAVKAMKNKNAILEIQTPNGNYKLPASQVLVDQLSQQLGAGTKLESITVHVDIAKSDNAKMELLANAADKGGFTVIVPPVDFAVTAVFDDKKVKVTKFNSFVEREIPFPEGADASEISTAVVLNEDGTTRSVPTKVVTRDGVTYVVVNSLTNSTYSVVWNPVEFEDVDQHWSKDEVNDMGSRMVISGVGNGIFNPDHDITRAEFAAIIVRGLGLELESGPVPFSDVKASAWYNDVVKTAHANNLINGYEDGTFRPNDKITREQAMVIISKAMEITKLSNQLSNPSTEATLYQYQDVTEISAWALHGIADTVQAGIVSGRSSTELAPKDNMTRAEVVVIIERLLRKSNLV